MIVCLDVHYDDQGARAAAVLARDWTSAEPSARRVASLAKVADYEPGKFYLRELEPLVAVLATLDESLECLVIDAYCQLSADGAPGLGAHLHRALGEKTPVVGVAKNRFRGTSHAAEVLRGESRRPLFVTACGLEVERAARLVSAMAGDSRIPVLLKAADRLARTAG